MPIVSVTRLHVRAWRFLPAFIVASYRSARQARHTGGFLTGSLGVEPPKAFWTMTVWQDDAAMRSFRNSGVHLHTMPKLLGWCDEASYVHWVTDAASVPTPAEAHHRLAGEGKVSKVNHPSAAQLAGRCAPGAAPLAGQRLTPLPER
jgi:hypothetical protein